MDSDIGWVVYLAGFQSERAPAQGNILQTVSLHHPVSFAAFPGNSLPPSSAVHESVVQSIYPDTF